METIIQRQLRELPRLQKPFKNESNQRYTKQLFYEQWAGLTQDERVWSPPFTLHQDIKGLTNFGREYVSDADPSGYTTAMRLLGEYSYFEYLMRVPWFREAKEQWDKEVDAKLYAEAIKKIRELSQGEDAKALQAAKYLANKEYKTKTSTKRGRPSKEEVAGELASQAKEQAEIARDLDRIKAVK